MLHRAEQCGVWVDANDCPVPEEGKDCGAQTTEPVVWKCKRGGSIVEDSKCLAGARPTHANKVCPPAAYKFGGTRDRKSACIRQFALK